VVGDNANAVVSCESALSLGYAPARPAMRIFMRVACTHLADQRARYQAAATAADVIAVDEYLLVLRRRIDDLAVRLESSKPRAAAAAKAEAAAAEVAAAVAEALALDLDEQTPPPSSSLELLFAEKILPKLWLQPLLAELMDSMREMFADTENALVPVRCFLYLFIFIFYLFLFLFFVYL
jgi:hypothetical protein